MQPKPLERRSLSMPDRPLREVGKLECWVDILTPAEAELFPKVKREA
jgi:hypothetical protein